MKKIILIGTGLLMLFVNESYAKNEVSAVDISVSGAATTLKLKFTQKSVYNNFLVLENPYRLLIDVSGSELFSGQSDTQINKGLIKNVRFEYEKSQLKSKPLLYMIFELTEMVSAEPELTDKALVFRLNRFSAELGQLTEQQFAREINSLDDALEIGIANNPNLKVAADEVKLAKIKKSEAYRALYPSLTAKYEQTRGDAVRETGVPEFDEKTYGVQMNQSLYYGGKLRATYKQAVCSYDVAKLKYDELLLNAHFEITKAFYNYIKAKKTFDFYSSLEKDAQKDVESSKKRYSMKLSTKIEYLTAETLWKQIGYNTLSFEKDYNLAALNLMQVLNIGKDSKLNFSMEIPYGDIDVGLAQALRIAELKRPDLKISRKELEVGELAKIIGKSSNGFKVDFNGFAGRSGGAYITEELEMGEDYSAALKISKPFGGNTLNGSYIFDKTSPKLGQSTRTQSTTGAVSMGIFDNIKGYSDALEGSINHKQYQVKLLEAKNNAEKEVRESVFNLEKAVLQVKSAKDEVTLAEEEVVAAKSKKDLNLSQISELISAKIKLAGGRKAYYEALAFFGTSLASLNKAVGASREFTIKK